MKASLGCLVVLCFLTSPDSIQADTFGIGDETFEMEFVAIGNPGNPADTTGSPDLAGSVPYEYRIGKYEVSEDMINKVNALSGLGITHAHRGIHKPATRISWFEAAKFVNWLNEYVGSIPAYKFDIEGDFQLWEAGDAGYDPDNLYRNRHAMYFLPDYNEWYKAAYYDPEQEIYHNYPTGSDIPPLPVASGVASGTAVHFQGASQGPADVMLAGGLSPYGTMAQGGNAYEWEETEYDLVNSSPFVRVHTQRGHRGGFWGNSHATLHAVNRGESFPDHHGRASGFRVASRAIPEPSALLLVVVAGVTIGYLREGLLFRNTLQ